MKDKSITKEFILKLIYSIIDEHNLLNPEDLKLEKSLDTSLFGNESKLDSLGLVNFLVEVENLINNNIDQDICVINEELFLDENGPYDNVKTLLDYIFLKIK
tara:strand:+ start:446 stop:751 length:306 start_codon:yes stop_codon:yes gene_type:complete